MKFKVGDKVYVRCGETTRKKYSINRFMEMLEGTPQTIHCVSPNGFYSIYDNVRQVTWNFAEEDVSYKPFSEGIINRKEKKEMDIDIEKIIFNKPATILYANGKRYVSKAYNEEFDEEKGLLMCLIKAFGISHLDLQRMIKGATVQEKKESKSNKTNPAQASKVLVEKFKPINAEIPSPKGRKRGKSYIFNVDDKVLIRDCDQYEYTTNATARKMLNRVWRVQDIDLDDTVIVNGVSFAKCELEKLKF